jgi:mannose-1-phosphate guanylyltransferase/mannose-1-phosphate guanylyltransferase/mannose-6-phosphate isomerase
MAGGSGTRLWPASNSRKPKQFLPAAISGTETFFSLSLERALRVTEENDGRVIVITGKTHLPFVITACSILSADKKKRLVLIPEPEAKNTAAAIACAITYAGKTGGFNRTMLVLTSDHVIKQLDVFIKDANTAAQFAAREKLAVFGISPSKPETGYGYIETAKRITEDVFTVAAFHEKPDQKKAEQYFASEKYFWNSGMFAFRCDFMAEEYRRIAADVGGPFEKLNAPDEKSYSKTEGLRVLDAWEDIGYAYNQAKRISFDYAIAEKCAQNVMIKAAFDWIDAGSWDDYAGLLSGNLAANTGTKKEIFAADASGCFIDSDISVALAGVEDLIIVIRSGKDGSPAAALITKKGKTQLVRDIVEKIKQAGKMEYL